MTAEHLEVAIEMITMRIPNHPQLQAMLRVLYDEMEKLTDPSFVQQALQQAQEELKKVQAENELLRKDLTQAQAENEQLKVLIHQLQTQPLSEQLKKLTEMAQQLENDLEQERAARVRAEEQAETIKTGDARTTIIHAQHVTVADIHHNDNNKTQIKP